MSKVNLGAVGSKARKMRGGGMVKKTGVKKFRTGGRVDLGAGDPNAAGKALTSDLLTAGMIYGAYKYGKKKGKSGGGKGKK